MTIEATDELHMRPVLFNGRIVPRSEVRIDPQDRGWRYGDGCFETVRVLYGKPYLLSEHLQRLSYTLRILGIACDANGLAADSRRLISHTGAQDGLLRIAITRGYGGEGYLPDPGSRPTVLIELGPCISESTPARLNVSRWRKIPPACLPSAGKTAQGLNSILARQEAAAAGADEALQLSIDGSVASASAANVFWLKNDRLYTPTLATGALAGVTRQRFLELSDTSIEEVSEPLATLLEADAVLLTNSRYLTRSVSHIDGHSLPLQPGCNWSAEWRARMEADAR